MTKPGDVTLLVVRTGPTSWDESGRMQGASDLPLSAGGREAVRSALQGVQTPELSVVYCGPDEASRETAEILASTLGPGTKVKPLDELAEINLGLWEGLKADDFEERFPKACRQWEEDPASVTPPAGESVNAARARIIPEVERLIAKVKKGSTIALVLRPMAFGLVQCWLTETPTCELWTVIKNRPAAVRFLLPGAKAPVTPAGAA